MTKSLFKRASDRLSVNLENREFSESLIRLWVKHKPEELENALDELPDDFEFTFLEIMFFMRGDGEIDRCYGFSNTTINESSDPYYFQGGLSRETDR
jgi:hypothetical protein